jgi:hypothetical protein
MPDTAFIDRTKGDFLVERGVNQERQCAVGRSGHSVLADRHSRSRSENGRQPLRFGHFSLPVDACFDVIQNNKGDDCRHG